MTGNLRSPKNWGSQAGNAILRQIFGIRSLEPWAPYRVKNMYPNGLLHRAHAGFFTEEVVAQMTRKRAIAAVILLLLLVVVAWISWGSVYRGSDETPFPAGLAERAQRGDLALTIYYVPVSTHIEVVPLWSPEHLRNRGYDCRIEVLPELLRRDIGALQLIDGLRLRPTKRVDRYAMDLRVWGELSSGGKVILSFGLNSPTGWPVMFLNDSTVRAKREFYDLVRPFLPRCEIAEYDEYLEYFGYWGRVRALGEGIKDLIGGCVPYWSPDEQLNQRRQVQ